MKKTYAMFILVLAICYNSYGQYFFDVSVDTAWTPRTVVLPPSPLKFQVLFVGGSDKVQTTATYGNEPGEALAKQWHDFIGQSLFFLFRYLLR